MATDFQDIAANVHFTQVIVHPAKCLHYYKLNRGTHCSKKLQVKYRCTANEFKHSSPTSCSCSLFKFIFILIEYLCFYNLLNFIVWNLHVLLQTKVYSKACQKWINPIMIQCSHLTKSTKPANLQHALQFLHEKSVLFINKMALFINKMALFSKLYVLTPPYLLSDHL